MANDTTEKVIARLELRATAMRDLHHDEIGASLLGRAAILLRATLNSSPEKGASP